MAAGKILGMALEAIGKGADEVADVVKSSKSAARKALDAVAEAGDDWGWKGGKPGEITGTGYTGLKSYLYSNRPPKLEELTEDAQKFANRYINSRPASYVGNMLEKMAEKQLLSSNSPLAQGPLEYLDIPGIMKDFSTLEKADIPREWTGKLLPALRAQLEMPFDRVPPITAKMVSDLMRPMTNEQRAEFVKELPNWEDSLESLAFFIQNV